jgi:hypothetical protein
VARKFKRVRDLGYRPDPYAPLVEYTSLNIPTGIFAKCFKYKGDKVFKLKQLLRDFEL